MYTSLNQPCIWGAVAEW